MEKNIRTITAPELRQGRQALAEELKQRGIPAREITLAQLLLEEMFFRLQKGMEAGADFSIRMALRRMWGDTELRLMARGAEYNPIPAVTETLTDEAEEDAYQLAILKTNRQKMGYVRKNGLNIVTIKVHELDSTKRQLIYTLSGLVLGCICGLFMQAFLGADVIKAINDSLIAPVRNVFLNALHMMMAPVTFFAIIAGITNISDAALIGKLGGRMVVVSLFMQVITALLGLGLGLLLFAGDLSYMQAGIAPAAGNAAAVQYGSLKDMVFDIVPRDLVEPFKGDKILQVMFLAIFFGLILNKMGDKAKGAVECIDFVFRFAIVTLKVIVKAIPLVVFLSMASLLASTGIESLLTFSGLFGGLFIGVAVVWLVGAMTILLFGRITPFSMTRKIMGLSPLIFTVSSSHARLPFVLKFCAENLGIDAKLAAFSIPVGVQLNKAGNCIFFSLVTLMLMRVYAIDMSTSLFLTLWVSVCIMAIAKPPIPCGGIICIAYLFTVVGVPAEAISVILCVEPIAAMFNGVCNESANIATTFILARENNMLDEKKYFA
ncbi:cation:dicarboxylate symporter family transporter [Selenomonas ruminantium]|uniref:cation:dicarboxylate symporter family transporter n=1 Tax=Selenomonas ruminantium TaxID=971 RepID=UPI00047A3D3D|nr:cation:dicarboxylase symporter family transporter [Selenomonas ruminantium]